MKRFLLAALVALSVTVQAQDFEHVGDVKGLSEWYIIPPSFYSSNYIYNGEAQTQFYTCEEKDYLYDEGCPYTYTKINIYSSDMSLIKTISAPSGVLEVSYVAGGETDFSEFPLHVSQALFDDDESYEFFTPIRNTDKECTGLHLMKDNGSIITTINFGGGNYIPQLDPPLFRIYQIYGKNLEKLFYLSIILRDQNHDYFTRYYSFEKGKVASTIKQVKDVRHGIKATPALPKANELVKVDLGGMKSPRTLSVVNANGAVVTRMSLEDGQQEANVSTHGLPAGMYIIRVSDGKTETDNCKIIVR